MNPSLNAKQIAVALIIIGTFGLQAAEVQPARPTFEKAPSPLRIAVFPFENPSGDPALDDWSQAWPGLVRMFLREATALEVPSTVRLKPALERGGWNARNKSAEAARSIGLDLKATTVIWGELAHRTNRCVATVTVLTPGSTRPPVQLEILSSNWVALAESAVLRLTEHLGQTHSAKESRYWRSQLPESDRGVALLGKIIASEIAEAPRSSQEEVLRKLLMEDEQCAFAYSRLLYLSVKEGRTNDFRKLTADFLARRPDICDAYVAMAHAQMDQGSDNAAEQGLREALRRHPGCPGATRGLFALATRQKGDPSDALQPLEEAFRLHPNSEQIRILLASVRAFKDDVSGARELLSTLDELPSEEANLDPILFKAALWSHSFELLGQQLPRLGPAAVTNSVLRAELAEIVFTKQAEASSTSMGKPPRKLSAAALQSELDRLLSPEERLLVVNPLEITPELVAEAQRLTVGLPNETTRIMALFSAVATRGRGRHEGPRHTASEALRASQDSQNRFVCQEFAKLFVGLTRAIGIESWLVHIDRDAFGYPAYHDCAAILINGEVFLTDPTWKCLFVPHQEFAVLDDVQAISHHMMQPLTEKPDPRRLRVGLKLNPEDRWTRVQFVIQMAEAGERAAAEEVLKQLERGPEKWDIPFAAAKLHQADGRWSQSVAALERALALSPSNAFVHLRIAQAYEQLGRSSEMEKHLALMLVLDRGEISAQTRESASLQVALGKLKGLARTEQALSQATLVSQAEAGDSAAQMALGQLAFNQGNLQEALDWLRKAANQGSALAQFNYANALIAAHGQKSGKEAMAWLTKAADQGAAEAQHDLGLMLYEGKLVPEDMVVAYSWMSLAAAQEHKKAKSMLRYMEIFISPDDLAKARKRAAEFKPVTKPTQKN